MSKKSSTFAVGFESVAQQVEHIPFKDGVLGSSPSWFTKNKDPTKPPHEGEVFLWGSIS